MTDNCKRGECISTEVGKLAETVGHIKEEVDKMVGARPLIMRILFIVVAATITSSSTAVYLALAANGVDSEQSVNIAVNAKAIEQIGVDIKREAEINRLEHEQFRKDRDAQTRLILEAIDSRMNRLR